MIVPLMVLYAILFVVVVLRPSNSVCFYDFNFFEDILNDREETHLYICFTSVYQQQSQF